MYYLHVMTAAPSVPQPHLRDHTHGPFASEREASGYFSKLSLWYPQEMRQAEFTITSDQNLSSHRKPRPTH